MQIYAVAYKHLNAYMHILTYNHRWGRLVLYCFTNESFTLFAEAFKHVSGTGERQNNCACV